MPPMIPISPSLSQLLPYSPSFSHRFLIASRTVSSPLGRLGGASFEVGRGFLRGFWAAPYISLFEKYLTGYHTAANPVASTVRNMIMMSSGCTLTGYASTTNEPLERPRPTMP